MNGNANGNADGNANGNADRNANGTADGNADGHRDGNGNGSDNVVIDRGAGPDQVCPDRVEHGIPLVEPPLPRLRTLPYVKRETDSAAELLVTVSRV